MGFDYFYEDQTQQFAFYRIPKVLFTDARFQGISTEGKVLYGLLLDRVSLSRDNGWIDEERMGYEAYLREQLEISVLKSRYPYDSDMIDGILELMLDILCSRRKMIRIAGDDKPANVVKGRFMKLNMGHIEYVMDCVRENTTKVRSIKQYLLAALYNAPATMDGYYRAEVNHDMATGKI